MEDIKYFFSQKDKFRETQPSEQELSDWKKKHQKIFHFEVDNFSCWLKRPSIENISLATSIGKTSVDIETILLKNCWLAGNEIFLNDDDYLQAIATSFSKEIELPECNITELGDKEYLLQCNEYEFKIKKPTREQASLAEQKNVKKKPFVTAQNLLEMVLIEGDKEALKNDDFLLMSLLKAVQEVQQTKLIAVKKN